MEREQFLNRIAQRHMRELLVNPPSRDTITLPEFQISLDSQTLAERFTMEMELVGGHVVCVKSIADAGLKLRKIISEQNDARLVTWQRHIFTHWQIDWLWDEYGALSIDAERQDHRHVLLNSTIGITLSDFAVAETGSLMLLTSPQSSRSVSLTPDVHIALLNSKDIVPTAEDAFAAIYARQTMPSSIHLISGPSRSADIENDLSIGVHGPAAVYVIILDAK